MNLSTKIAATLVVGIILGSALGFLLAVNSLRLERQVDYDSGAEREIVKIGPISVRDDLLRNSGFGELVMRDGGRGLTGNPDWHMAAIFWGRSRVSPTFEAAHVLKAVRRLDLLLRDLPFDKAQAVKENFLRALAEGGVDKAEGFMRDTEPILLRLATEQ